MKFQQDPCTTNPSPRAASRYVNFLKAAQGRAPDANLPALDPIEERLLQAIILKNVAGERLGVRDVIHDETLGSSSMLHRRIMAMRKKGWLQLDNTEDARRKRVALTEAAMQYLDWLGSCILDAAQ